MICIITNHALLYRGDDQPSPSLYLFSLFSMFTGTIKKKVENKGFGFIAVEGSEDIFFHMSACNGQFNNLPEGTAVQFDTEESPKGKRAVNLVAVGAAENAVL